MDNQKRSTLSWSASLVVHATGAVMILVAGFHIATPNGTVTDKTEFVTVDVNTPASPAQASAQVQPQPVAQAQPVAQPPVTDAAPPTSPDIAEPQQAEANSDPESEGVPKPFTPTETDDNAPPAQEVASANEDPAQDPSSATEDAAPPTETANATPVAAPIAAPEGTPGENPNLTPAPSPNINGSGDVTQAQGTPEAGTQGPLIDETKLMEAFGNHKPDYPWMARLRRQQGTVILRAFVDKDGGVSQVTVEKSSGSQLIDEEAQRTYSRWRYQPGLTGQVLKPFKFSLK